MYLLECILGIWELTFVDHRGDHIMEYTTGSGTDMVGYLDRLGTAWAIHNNLT